MIMNIPGNAHFSAIAEPARTRMAMYAVMHPVRARCSPVRTTEPEFQEAPI